VPPNVAAILARRARPSNLLSTQTQDRFDRLPTDAVDHFIDGQPRVHLSSRASCNRRSPGADERRLLWPASYFIY
jgi:hypothetical protein